MTLEPEGAEPLYRQLYAELRRAILGRRLAPGARIPSSRLLAADLGVSRNTVSLAFGQLLAEGYLEGRLRSGTFVARAIPDRMLTVPGHLRGPAARTSETSKPPPGLSARGRMLAATTIMPYLPTLTAPRPFRAGVPALDLFPRALWSRLMARHWRRQDLALAYADPGGHPPLREALAGYLRAARGVRCEAEQVIVVSGSQQALDLTARSLLDPGDQVWVEDPGYLGARGALSAAGARLVPVPVDRDGLDVAAGIRAAPKARLAYVCPSHQYPTGATMSAARRLALLAWARKAGAWILEDDYDSEFRFAGRPLPALQGLDPDGRVIYVGTLSKTLAPALRLGYLVVPAALAEAFSRARAVTDRHSPTVEQAVLADFIGAGHFARHVRRMRARYAERREALVQALDHELVSELEIVPSDAGMHLLGWLPAGVDDAAVARRALAAGIEVRPLSSHSLNRLPRGGLLLGFAAFEPRQLRRAAAELAKVLRR